MTTAYAGLGTGTGRIFASFDARGEGASVMTLSRSGRVSGLHRIADDDLDAYELYRGVDVEADLAGAPWETFSALPHDTAPLDPSHTYHFVLRHRNAWNLLSQNLTEWTVTLDGDGAQVETPPSAPIETELSQEAGCKVRVQSHYFYAADGAEQASRFLVYLTSDGDDPDPDVDTPAVVAMSKVDGVAKLSWLSDAFADATVVKVLVRARRVEHPLTDPGPPPVYGTVNIDSINTDVEQITIDATGPGAPSGGIFFEEIAEQGQGGGGAA